MFTQRFNLFVALFFLFTSSSFAQGNSRWSVGFKSSYFGDQSRQAYQITGIDMPISLGLQMQVFLRNDLALQYSAENMNGKTNESLGEELNVQSSFAIVAYPFKFWKFRPYLTQGILWRQRNSNREAVSKNNFYYEIGFGTEFTVSGNFYNSIAAKLYSDGGNYHGWSTSYSIGFRL